MCFREILVIFLYIGLVFIMGCDKTTLTVPIDGGTSDAQALEHGILGRFSALTAHSGTLMASAYENRFGDLVFITVSTSDLSKLTKEIIDGVPNLPPSKATDGWRKGIVEPGDDVGLDTDITVSGDGDPMISYFDRTNLRLKFAKRSGGKWRTHEVQKVSGGKEIIGRFSALVLHNGNPAIAFLALNISNGKNGFKSELRWAGASSASPMSSSDWTITTIDLGDMSCVNLCAKNEVCVLEKDGASTCAQKGTGCGECGKEQECVGGKCVTVLPNSTIADIPLALGLWPTITEVSGNPVVMYYDRTKGNLKGATLSSGIWKTSIIKGTGKDNLGAYSSSAGDVSGIIHVAYQNVDKGTLEYIQVNGTTLMVTKSEVIDDGIRPKEQHLVGADPAILVTSNNKVMVIYQDAQTADLLLAERDGDNNWIPNKPNDPDLGRKLKSGPMGYGFFSDMVSEGSAVYGSTFYYDQKVQPQGGIEFFLVQ